MDRNIIHQDTGLQWMVQGPGVFQVCGQTFDRLPAGAYACQLDACGSAQFVQRQLMLDELIDFPGSLPSRIMAEIDNFWGLGERFARLGFLHRRGYLLYGKQGSGKSSIVHQILGRTVAADNIAFFGDCPPAFVRAVAAFRKVEPHRPVVCVFEDIDAIIAQYGDSDLLQWLDSNQQVDRAVSRATTNYPENLDPRIVSRPRRFDRILRIDAPDERLRTAYFARKLPEQPIGERQRWVQLTEGLPFAALAELVISVCCLGNSVDETLAQLRGMDAGLPSSREYSAEASSAA
jgi:hypothetical protein